MHLKQHRASTTHISRRQEKSYVPMHDRPAAAALYTESAGIVELANALMEAAPPEGFVPGSVKCRIGYMMVEAVNRFSRDTQNGLSDLYSSPMPLFACKEPYLLSWLDKPIKIGSTGDLDGEGSVEKLLPSSRLGAPRQRY